MDAGEGLELRYHPVTTAATRLMTSTECEMTVTEAIFINHLFTGISQLSHSRFRTKAELRGAATFLFWPFVPFSSYTTFCSA